MIYRALMAFSDIDKDGQQVHVTNGTDVAALLPPERIEVLLAAGLLERDALEPATPPAAPSGEPMPDTPKKPRPRARS